MKELKADHQAGKISDEKYRQLSRQYMLKLKNIDASSRIRTMQGRPNSFNQPHNYRPDKRAAELSRREDEKLVKKYVVNPRTGKSNKSKNKTSNKGKYAIIATIFLIFAFTTGIGFGMVNFDFQSSNTNSSVLVADSAFPIELNNVSTLNSSTTSNSAKTDSSSTTSISPKSSSGSSTDTPINPDDDSGKGGGSDSGKGGGSDSGGDDEHDSNKVS